MVFQEIAGLPTKKTQRKEARYFCLFARSGEARCRTHSWKPSRTPGLKKKHLVPRPAAGYIKYKPWVPYAGPAGFTADAADGCSAGGTGVVRHDALQVNLSKALRRRW